ncbi:hypothetical protein XBFFR1_2320006 [Xenorhabdus bovienii str. feltiae France]|nr:hypothetical protein XBFFR1_2320006 [Xenorhabdus bovienii str. feltiae France]
MLFSLALFVPKHLVASDSQRRVASNPVSPSSRYAVCPAICIEYSVTNWFSQ